MGKVLHFVSRSKCIGCLCCMLACARTNQNSLSPLMSAIRISTAGGYQTPIVAEYCRGCLDPECAKACPTGALVPRKEGGVIFKESLCVGCKNCVDACPLGVISFREDKKIPIICRQCGVCAKFCPHKCLVMVDKETGIGEDGEFYEL